MAKRQTMRRVSNGSDGSVDLHRVTKRTLLAQSGASAGTLAAVKQANFVPEVQQNPALKFATDHIERIEPAQVPKNGNAADTIAFDVPNSIWGKEINALRGGKSVQETAAEMKR